MLEGLKRLVWRFSARSHANGLILLALGALILAWHLGTATAGFSPAEKSFRDSSSSASAIWHNPLNAPLKLLLYLFQSIGWHSPFGIRLASAIFGLFLVICFYLVARSWFGKQAGLLGALLVLSTAWVIVAARQATPDILLLAPAALLMAYMQFAKRKRAKLSWLALCLVLGISFYIPGMIWLTLLTFILLGSRLKGLWLKLDPKLQAIGGAIFLITITPLVMAVVKDSQILKGLLLIPVDWVGWSQSLTGILWAAASLVWRTANHFELTVGRWPLLSVAQVVLLLFGSFAIWQKARKLFLALASFIGFIVIAAGLNQHPELLLLATVPLGFLITAGLRYIYLEWRSVFPRNPIPQAFAVIVIAGLVAVQLWFGVRYALIAWPHTADTHNLYVLK